MSELLVNIITFGSMSAYGPWELMLIMFVIGLIPSIIAFKKNHPHRLFILILNILLGWTFIGWIAALVWALLPEKDNSQSQD